MDGFSHLRNCLREIADRDQSWAGIPMPMSGFRLSIEPKFPNASAIADIGVTQEMKEREARSEVENAGWKIRNRFWSFHRKCRVVIAQTPEGKVRWYPDYGTSPTDRLLHLLDLSSAWGIEQEGNAVRTLGTLIRHHQFKTYLLTGMFIEKSRRTGLFYIFRKLRPTVVIEGADVLRIRCALCMHPIGYYEDTWAGAMTPTDDVIAHLMLMRADEPMFWRRANQHPPWIPESGINL